MKRWRGAMAALLVGGMTVAVLAPAIASTVAPTEAAWTDRSVAVASVSAGTWKTPSTCTAYTRAGVPLAGGWCIITAMNVQSQWSDGTKVVRNMGIGISTNAGDGYVMIDVDLSSAVVPPRFSGQPWSWQNAALLRGSQVTPLAAGSCPGLPRLKANGPVGWWTGYTIFLQVVENRSTATASELLCS